MVKTGFKIDGMGKQPKGDRGKDRHEPHKMLRIPLELYQELEEVAAFTDRPIVWEARRALRKHISEIRKLMEQGKAPD